MFYTPRFTEETAHPNWTLQSVRWGSPSLHKNTRLIPEHPHKSLFCAINSAWCSRLFFSQVVLLLLYLCRVCFLAYRCLQIHKCLQNVNNNVYAVHVFMWAHTYKAIYVCTSIVGWYKAMAFFLPKQCVCKWVVLKGRCCNCPAAMFLFRGISIRA